MFLAEIFLPSSMTKLKCFLIEAEFNRDRQHLKAQQDNTKKIELNLKP
jgi:hypothetical protein